jgi:hypothetical protein
VNHEFASVQAANAHFDAEQRIPMVWDRYIDALHTLNNRRADDQATRADWERVVDLAGELARLHTDESDYYTRLTAVYAERAAEAADGKR